jgi:hypothetical protein
MLIGSSIQEVLQVNTPPPTAASQTSGANEETTVSKEPLSLQLPHKKIIEKGLPEEAEKGDRTRKDPLPLHGIRGLYNNHGTKVRLTFKVSLCSSCFYSSLHPVRTTHRCLHV